MLRAARLLERLDELVLVAACYCTRRDPLDSREVGRKFFGDLDVFLLLLS